MLRITVTLLPASGGPAREIGRLDIHNEDTGTRARGNYVARLMRRGTTDRVQRIAEVLDYPRESLPVWCLVHRALAALFARGRFSPADGPTAAAVGEDEPAPADDEDACIVCNHSAEKADLIRSAEAAIAALSNEGFPGRDIEAQVRALIREWSEEREMARLLRGSAQAEAGKAQVLRSAAESIDAWGIGSRDAIAYGVRTLDWVKFCEWKTEADGVKRTMIIGTSDGGGMDDARYSEFRAVLDAHRCAGARVLVDVDGTSFTHPPPPPPCAKCGVQTLASGECSNFPACPNAILPF